MAKKANSVEGGFVMVGPQHLSLSGTALKVYIALALHGTWRDGRYASITASQKTIASKAQIGVRTVQRVLDELTKSGFVQSTRRMTESGDPDTNSYIVLFEVATQVTGGGVKNDATPKGAEGDVDGACPTWGSDKFDVRVVSDLTGGVVSQMAYNPEPSNPEPVTHSSDFATLSRLRGNADLEDSNEDHESQGPYEEDPKRTEEEDLDWWDDPYQPVQETVESVSPCKCVGCVSESFHYEHDGQCKNDAGSLNNGYCTPCGMAG